MKKMTRREFNYLLGAGSASLWATPLFTAKAMAASSDPDEWFSSALDRIEQNRKAPLSITVLSPDGHPLPSAVVQLQMKRHAFGFGSAVSARHLAEPSADGEAYRSFVEKTFNRAVFENDLKESAWKLSQSNRDLRFRREWTEQSLEWLSARRIPVRGHHLVSARFRPEEYTAALAESKRWKTRIFQHMEDILEATRGRISEWDAINHIAELNHTLETMFDGPAIYAEIIRRARELAPDSDLWVNEGTILSLEDRRDHYHNVIRYLSDYGARPDGIGLMGHFCEPHLPSAKEVYAQFDRYATLVPRLQITELDIRTGNDEQAQADYLRTIMTAAFSHPAMESISAWGFWEGRHPHPQAALFLRQDWSSKPAGDVWKELVFHDWWTSKKGRTSPEGQFTTRGFLGEYEVSAHQAGRSKTETVLLTHQGANLRIQLS